MNPNALLSSGYFLPSFLGWRPWGSLERFSSPPNVPRTPHNPHAPQVIKPLLSVKRATGDLGDGTPGETKHGKMTLCNTSDAELTFSIVGSCNCLRLEPRSGKIGRGENRTVEVDVKLKGHGSSETVTLNIEAVAGARKQVEQILFTARCPLPISTRPLHADFGRVPQGKGASLTLQLLAKNNAPWKERGLQAQVSSPYVQAVLHQDAAGAELRLTLSPDAPAGLLRSEVTVLARDKDISTTIPLSADVVRPVQFAPAVLRFPSGSSRRMTFLVWRGDGAPVGTLKPQNLPAGVEVRVLSEPGARRLRALVTLADGVELPEGTKLQLRCDSVDGGTLEVPLFAEL
jgi:hypothetical protein